MKARLSVHPFMVFPGSAEFHKCVGLPLRSNIIFGRSRRHRLTFPAARGGYGELLEHRAGPHCPLWQPGQPCALYWSLEQHAPEYRRYSPSGSSPVFRDARFVFVARLHLLAGGRAFVVGEMPLGGLHAL